MVGLDALIGGALGGIARLAPEVMKFFDRKAERQHELSLGAQQQDLIKLQSSTHLAQTQVETDAAQIVAGVQALQSAYASQKTGFKFADSLSASVRPVVTYIIVGAWLLVKAAAYSQLTAKGISWDVAALSLWNGDDVMMLAGVTNFWFLSRVFERKS
jgi:hypothetical protein